MAHAFARLVRCEARAAVVAGPAIHGHTLPGAWRVYEPAHPFPDQISVEAGQHALRLAREPHRHRFVLLLSGGASSMLCLPAHGVTLEDKVTTSKALMEAGIPIDGLNCVRKHLSGIKGGQLGAAAERSVTLAISDVHHPVTDDPSVIGSGPTVADPTTFAQALEIVAKLPDVPRGVIRRFEAGCAGEIPETIKPHDPRLRHAEFIVLGNRHSVLEAAARSAGEIGYGVVTIDQPTHGEARAAAVQFMAAAEALAHSAPRPLCILAAGETTVRVVGSGTGGRNQEFVLSAGTHLRPLGTSVLASVGTDGRDGPTDAAGAIADSTTLDRAARAGLDAAAALAANDAYPFFAALGDLIISGPTGTNVGDLHVLLIA